MILLIRSISGHGFLEPRHEKTEFLLIYAKTKTQIDQLCSNCTADQRLCFRSSDSIRTFFFFVKSEISSFYTSSVTA